MSQHSSGAVAQSPAGKAQVSVRDAGQCFPDHLGKELVVQAVHFSLWPEKSLLHCERCLVSLNGKSFSNVSHTALFCFSHASTPQYRICIVLQYL